MAGRRRPSLALRSGRRPGALCRGPRQPVASGIADQDHDGLRHLRCPQGGQADHGEQDRLLRASQQPVAQQDRPARRRRDDGGDGAAGPHRQVGQRRCGDAGRGGFRVARRLRGAHECHGCAPGHDAHQVRECQWSAGDGAGHDGARPGQARLRGRARLSRACAIMVDAGGAARQAAPAYAQRHPHQLRRRRRHEDRFHLRQRLQRRGQRHPRRPQAHSRRARRAYGG